MNIRKTIFFFSIILFQSAFAQSKIDSFHIYSDVKITVDAPVHFKKKTKTILIIYALPNGNSTEQTMGKILREGDDWHFDIQHIKAQTAFIRNELKENIVVAYLENNFKSWPLWKQKHTEFKKEIQHIVETISNMVKTKIIYLNGHSGGGSFIFGYLDGIEKIPSSIQRISFIDSNYGYDSSYYNKFKNWLVNNNGVTLTVFAYNDSVALYNGKPVVSAKGGTWYKSRIMLQQLQKNFEIQKLQDDSLIMYADKKKRIGLFFKTNPEQKILHTQQVELNGFIHSILLGTKKESEGYKYFGQRAYSKFIE
jgi:hypothetical protein